MNEYLVKSVSQSALQPNSNKPEPRLIGVLLVCNVAFSQRAWSLSIQHCRRCCKVYSCILCMPCCVLQEFSITSWSVPCQGAEELCIESFRATTDTSWPPSSERVQQGEGGRGIVIFIFEMPNFRHFWFPNNNIGALSVRFQHLKFQTEETRCQTASCLYLQHFAFLENFTLGTHQGLPKVHRPNFIRVAHVFLMNATVANL